MPLPSWCGPPVPVKHPDAAGYSSEGDFTGELIYEQKYNQLPGPDPGRATQINRTAVDTHAFHSESRGLQRQHPAGDQRNACHLGGGKQQL